MAKSTKPRSPRSRSAQDKKPETQQGTPELEATATETPEGRAVEMAEPAVETTPDGPETPEQTTERPDDPAFETTQDALDDPVDAIPPTTDDVTENAAIAAETPAEEMSDITEPAPNSDPAPRDASDETPPPSETATPEAAEFPPPAPVHQPRIARGPGFFTLLLGGVIAGGIGYAIAEFDVFDQGAPDPLAGIETRLADQTARIEAMTEKAAANSQATEAVSADLATLREEMAALPPATGATDPALADRLGAVEGRLDDLSAQLAGLPGDTGASNDALSGLSDAVSENAAQLAALQAELDSQRAAIAEASAAAEQARDASTAASTAADAARSASADETRRITVQAALAQLSAALQNGTPYVEITSALETAGGLSIPAGLAGSADSGVATLAALQNDFPAAARKALTVSIRETSGGGVLDRFGAFLRTQTGARSLDAREGDDPDAILSRAQAAVNAGDLEAALSEIAALPESGQAAMADWSGRAQARLDASRALDDLRAAMNSNQGRN